MGPPSCQAMVWSISQRAAGMLQPGAMQVSARHLTSRRSSGGGRYRSRPTESTIPVSGWVSTRIHPFAPPAQLPRPGHRDRTDTLHRRDPVRPSLPLAVAVEEGEDGDGDGDGGADPARVGGQRVGDPVDQGVAEDVGAELVQGAGLVRAGRRGPSPAR